MPQGASARRYLDLFIAQLPLVFRATGAHIPFIGGDPRVIDWRAARQWRADVSAISDQGFLAGSWLHYHFIARRFDHICRIGRIRLPRTEYCGFRFRRMVTHIPIECLACLRDGTTTFFARKPRHPQIDNRRSLCRRHRPSRRDRAGRRCNSHHKGYERRDLSI